MKDPSNPISLKCWTGEQTLYSYSSESLLCALLAVREPRYENMLPAEERVDLEVYLRCNVCHLIRVPILVILIRFALQGTSLEVAYQKELLFAILSSNSFLLTIFLTTPKLNRNPSLQFLNLYLQCHQDPLETSQSYFMNLLLPNLAHLLLSHLLLWGKMVNSYLIYFAFELDLESNWLHLLKELTIIYEEEMDVWYSHLEKH